MLKSSNYELKQALLLFISFYLSIEIEIKFEQVAKAKRRYFVMMGQVIKLFSLILASFKQKKLNCG